MDDKTPAQQLLQKELPVLIDPTTPIDQFENTVEAGCDEASDPIVYLHGVYTALLGTDSRHHHPDTPDMALRIDALLRQYGPRAVWLANRMEVDREVALRPIRPKVYSNTYDLCLAINTVDAHVKLHETGHITHHGLSMPYHKVEALVDDMMHSVVHSEASHDRWWLNFVLHVAGEAERYRKDHGLNRAYYSDLLTIAQRQSNEQLQFICNAPPYVSALTVYTAIEDHAREALYRGLLKDDTDEED